MNKGLIAVALMGLLGAFGAGCSSTACDDLVTAYEDCGATVGDGDSGEEADCSDGTDAAKAANCILDNVADVCKPTVEESTKVGECFAG
jgi:hypothetical protein